MSTAAALEVHDVDVVLGGTRVLHGVSLLAAAGEVVGLLGPNGSGKSTLLRTAYGVTRPAAGTVHIAGLNVGTTRPRELARRCAVLTQDHAVDLELSVLDVVLLGRIPHPRAMGGRRSNVELARTCLARVDGTHLTDRAFPTLSGGERQRVLLARALCQEPQVLLLDEPTNHLDVSHQLELLAMVTSLDITCVVALHDLTLAATYCDRIALMADGQVVAQGRPAEVLTPARVEDVYGVACDVLSHPRTHRPLIAVSRRAPAAAD
ncbi:ABC transporter ATP-binding protein [Mumia sp. Pv 4-285]|uniref:ABC transporter ATP-binding protein n=1 Tax=Mumia qirimensis TaxID=3234852 RepID=UPI00351D47B0